MVHIGVLGIQGDYALHQKMLKSLDAAHSNVRLPEDLSGCDGLIIPGGESTTLIKLLKKTGLFEAISEYALQRPVMGTCAGLITLATELTNFKMDTLGLIDISVERNGFGRQVNSFIDTVQIDVFPDKKDYEGVFIRAPRIKALGEQTQAVASWKDEVVMVRNEKVLGLTFHPELTQDSRIHEYFIETFVRK